MPKHTPMERMRRDMDQGMREALDMPKHGNPSQQKAEEMLQHGEIKGKPLTKKQKGFFGAVAHRKKPQMKK